MQRFSSTSPFLFALASLLYSYGQVLHLVSFAELFRLVGILWLLLVVLYYPARLIAGTGKRASLLLTIFVLGFCATQSFFYLASSIIVIILISSSIFLQLRGFKIDLARVSLLVTGSAVTMIMIYIYSNLGSFYQLPFRDYQRSVKQAKSFAVEASSVSAYQPDIYYIVLDGYLRSDMLWELYGYDNTPFISSLEKKGFFVPSDIHSNYARTVLSIPSTLNMDYINSFASGLENSYFWWLMEPFIDHSRVRAVLESQGYTTVSVGTNWGLTNNSTTDLYFHRYPIMLTDFENHFLNSTPWRYLKPVLEGFTPALNYNTHRQIITYTFDALTEIPDIPTPKFVFVHIISPHPPFVFNHNGDPVDPSRPFSFSDASDFEGELYEYQEGYVAQIEYVNIQIQSVIETILQKSKQPPIIIIQADHGSGLLTDFFSAENTCIKERFSPFGAYYLPGSDSDIIPSNITPVNLFRIILNQYFGTQFQMLENRQYYSEGGYLYDLIDVTSRVDEACSVD